MSHRVSMSGDSFDLGGATANAFEVRSSSLRLRPHSHITASEFCDVAAGPFIVPAAPSGDLRSNQPDLALNGKFVLFNLRAVAPVPLCFAGYEALRLNAVAANAAFRLQPLPTQSDPSEWTIHLWISSTNLTAGRTIASNYAAINGLKKWQLVYTNSTTLTLSFYNAAGANTDITIAINPAIGVGHILYIKFGYRYITDGTSIGNLYCYRWEELAWTLLGNNSANNLPQMPVPEDRQQPGLTICGSYDTNMSLSNSFQGIILSLRRFTTYDAGAVVKPTVPSPIYGTTQNGVTATLDSGSPGSDWDAATAAVGDSTQWAAAVGNAGYTLKYECADVLTGVYSAEMTLTQFQAQGILTGRYLKVQFICVSNGFNNYEVAWIGVNATNPVPITVPAQPVIMAYSRSDRFNASIEIAGIAAGHTIHIYGGAYLQDTFNWIEVGTVVSTGVNMTIPLDMTAFSGGVFFGATLGNPAAVFAIAENTGVYGPISAEGRAGLFGLTWTPTITSVRSADKLSADVTITGVPIDGVCMVAWNTAYGIPSFTAFAGSGTFNVPGLDPVCTFSPTLIAFSQAVRMEGLVGYCDPFPINAPHSYVKKVPHSHEVT